MDLTVIIALASGAVIIVLLFFVFYKYESGKKKPETLPERRGAPQPRNARARARLAQQQQIPQRGGGGGEIIDDDREEDVEHEKIGAKKRAKLEAKAEKKAQREQEEREREERKKKKEQAEEERRKREEKELEEEKLKEEEAKREEEERERKEHEEYLKLKSAFSVEEEGYGDIDIGENVNLLQEFITYIQNMKVVTFEELAAKFSMKTQSVIDRVQDLQKEGRLTGVVDDRGKFIYISQKELEAVAKFVKQRGRVSLAELVENSHRLVNLVPNISVES